MSRVGRLPISIPKGIEISQDNHVVTVKGPKGTLQEKIHPSIEVTIDKEFVSLKRSSDSHYYRALHGLFRTLIKNMIIGSTSGYQKRLEIVGMGFRAELNGKTVVFQLGYSHPIYLIPPEGITVELPTPTVIIVKGIDKHLVGQIASKIRSLRPPEPYKGTGIRYEGEYVKHKAGKATV